MGGVVLAREVGVLCARQVELGGRAGAGGLRGELRGWVSGEWTLGAALLRQLPRGLRLEYESAGVSAVRWDGVGWGGMKWNGMEKGEAENRGTHGGQLSVVEISLGTEGEPAMAVALSGWYCGEV